MKFIKKNIILVIFVFILFTYSSEALAKERLRIGVIFSANIPYYSALYDKISKSLKKTLGKNRVDFIVQRPNPDPLAWSNAIRKLIVYDAELLIVFGSGALKTTMYEDVEIPVVFAGVYEIENKDYLKRKNLSGVFHKIHLTSIIRYLKKTKKISTIDILASEIEDSSVSEANNFYKMCKSFNIHCTLHTIQNYSDIASYLTTSRTDALFITESALLAKYIPEFSKEFLKRKIPIVSTMPGLDNVTLFSLKPDIKVEAKALSQLIVNVYKKKAEKKHFHLITKTSLSFNFGIAKTLETNIPPELLSSADEVIK